MVRLGSGAKSRRLSLELSSTNHPVRPQPAIGRFQFPLKNLANLLAFLGSTQRSGVALCRTGPHPYDGVDSDTSTIFEHAAACPKCDVYRDIPLLNIALMSNFPNNCQLGKLASQSLGGPDERGCF